MVSIIINYLFKILNKKNNIKENFDFLNLKYLDDDINSEENTGESDEDIDEDIELKMKERELKLKELEMRERELKDKEWNEIKRKEREIREKEIEDRKIRDKESETIVKEKPKEDNIYGCNKREVKNSIWGQNYDNDLEYNELPEDMMEPLGKIDTSYSYMPPWKWWPPRAKPPMCSREAKCSPCPITTMGTPTDVKEWDSSRYVTPGLGINIPYIEKLNRQYNEKIN